MDDYSPVVSDIEDQNDDENETRAKSKRTPKEDIADIDIMQKILNEQSTSKCELEEGNNSDQGEDTEFLEADSSKCFFFLLITSSSCHLYCKVTNDNNVLPFLLQIQKMQSVKRIVPNKKKQFIWC